MHSFLIILNAEEPRLNEQLQATLKIFSQMFGPEFFENAMLVFTHFYQDERSIRERKNNNKMSENRVINEYTQHFIKDF